MKRVLILIRFLNAAIFLAIIPVSDAFARRAYFIGTVAYNDSLKDLQDPKSTLPEGFREGSCTSNFCYKLLSCQIMVSNISDHVQNITGFSISLNWFFTKGRNIEGPNTNEIDPMLDNESQPQPWISGTTTNTWSAGRPCPDLTLYKFNHASASSELVPTATGYTGAERFPLNSNETALIVIGNQSFGPGGGIDVQSVGSFYSSPYKNLGTCWGYIDVEDANSRSQGAVIASGSLEGKAGAYANPVIQYGARAVQEEIAPNPWYPKGQGYSASTGIPPEEVDLPDSPRFFNDPTAYAQDLVCGREISDEERIVIDNRRAWDGYPWRDMPSYIESLNRWQERGGVAVYLANDVDLIRSRVGYGQTEQNSTPRFSWSGSIASNRVAGSVSSIDIDQNFRGLAGFSTFMNRDQCTQESASSRWYIKNVNQQTGVGQCWVNSQPNESSGSTRTAGWQETIFNSPIIINGGSPF